MSNPYAADAAQLIHRAEMSENAEGYDNHMQAAGVKATLALAYEQRTANLIALFGKMHPNGSGVFPHPLLEAAQREIQERLELS